MINVNRRQKLLGLLIQLMVLVSCSQGARPPIEVDIISIEPEPTVGQVTTVTFTVKANAANRDIPSTVITPYLFKVVESEQAEAFPIWEGTLLAEEPLELSWTFCLPEPGRWRLIIDAQVTIEGATEGWGGDSRFIESDFDHAEVARYFEGSSEIRITVDPTPIVSPRDTPTLIPNDNRDENGLIRPIVEPVINLSQECLEANTPP